MAISKVIFKASAEATPEIWMDTTDKTADSGNMLNGITALKNDGTTATGNIQSQAAQTIYPSTSDQTIASGKYLTGTQTVKGVLLTNLSAGNIKKDVVVKVGDSADDDRITSVTGTYEGGGGGNADFKAFLERTTNTPNLPSGLTSLPPYGCAYWTSLALTSLPNSITSIGNRAFYGDTALSLTVLPSSLITIGQYAFGDCSNLAISSLPNSVTYIDDYAFRNCSGLTTITGNGNITKIGQQAFTGSTSYPMSLTAAYFPNAAGTTYEINSVFGSSTANSACQQLEIVDVGAPQKIQANSFANCYKLQTLILRRTAAITALMNVSAFTNTPMSGYNSLTGTVYVPNALISTYQIASNWKTLYDAGYISFVKIEGSIYE